MLVYVIYCFYNRSLLNDENLRPRRLEAPLQDPGAADEH